MKTLILLTLVAITFAVEISTIDISNLRNPGDVLFSTCRNVTVSGQNINNVCITLSEDDNCGVTVVLSIAGVQVINDNLDLEATPEVCGQYSLSGVTCNLCVSLPMKQNDNTQRCIVITPTCFGSQLPSETVSCIPESTFDGVIACSSGLCPNQCSGHGTCSNGTCTCDTGYYSMDCSASEPVFSQCVKVDDLTGDICVRISYAPCTIAVETVAVTGGAELELYSKNYSVKYLATAFANDMCASFGICDACIKWSNLILNTSEASGCGTLNLNCPLKDYNYDLGCFEDHDVLPSCFICPNNCSGHGTCNNGICDCDGFYVGEDCASTQPCPNACSGHGTCSPQGTCSCNEDWAGLSCSIQKDHSSSSTQSKSHKGAIIGSVIVLLVLGVAAGAAYYIWKRKHSSNEAKFTQLNMITAHEHDEEQFDD